MYNAIYSAIVPLGAGLSGLYMYVMEYLKQCDSGDDDRSK